MSDNDQPTAMHITMLALQGFTNAARRWTRFKARIYRQKSIKIRNDEK